MAGGSAGSAAGIGAASSFWSWWRDGTGARTARVLFRSPSATTDRRELRWSSGTAIHCIPLGLVLHHATPALQHLCERLSFGWCELAASHAVYQCFRSRRHIIDGLSERQFKPQRGLAPNWHQPLYTEPQRRRITPQSLLY